MKKIIMIILVLVIAAGGVWFFVFNKKTDEELIKEQLAELADACSKNAEETSVTMALKNARIANTIAGHCSVAIPQAMMNGTFTPMEFAGSMTRSRAMFSTLRGTIEEAEVTVSEGQNKAVVDYSVRVTGALKKGDAVEEARDLRSEVVKEEDKWKFSSFEIREVLEK